MERMHKIYFILVAFLILALGVIYLYASQFGLLEDGKWKHQYGWTKIAGPAIGKATALGQAINLKKRASYINIMLATFRGKPKGYIDILILKGNNPPKALAEINKRLLLNYSIDARDIKDSSYYKIVLPRLSYYKTYIIIKLNPTIDFDGSLTVWLDSVKEWVGPDADLINFNEKLITTDKLPGHFTVEIGYEGGHYIYNKINLTLLIKILFISAIIIYFMSQFIYCLKPANRAITCGCIYIISIYGTLYCLFGERLLYNGGLGMDGTIYANIVQNLPGSISEITPYYLSRIFPLIVVRVVMIYFEIPNVDLDVVETFRVVNIFLICLSFLFWAKIVDQLNLKSSTFILGSIGLFLNYATFKYYLYYSNLTDPMAFCLSFVVCYAFVLGRQKLLLLSVILFSFTWPNMIYFGFLLYCFPYFVKNKIEIKKYSIKKGYILSVLIAISFYGIIYLLAVITESKYLNLEVTAITYISFATNIIFIIIGIYHLIKYDLVTDIRFYLSGVSFINLFLYALFIIIYVLIMNIFPSSESRIGMLTFFIRLIRHSNTYPFYSLVAHATFWGPSILLMYFYWPQISRLIVKMGPGIVGVAMIGIILSIFPESRLHTNIIPFFIVIFFIASDNYSKTKYGIAIFALISLASTKMWLPVNKIVGVNEYGEKIIETVWDHYFLNFGCWMPLRYYIIQGILVVVIMVGYYWARKKYEGVRDNSTSRNNRSNAVLL